MRTRWHALPLQQRQRLTRTLGVMALVLYPAVDALFHLRLLNAVTDAAVLVILALGLNIVVGFAGLLDLGYAAFFAIGAYGYGISASGQLKPAWSSLWAPLEWAGQVTRLVVPGQADTVQFHFAFWPMLAISAIICAIFGMLFGAPTLRLRGDY